MSTKAITQLNAGTCKSGDLHVAVDVTDTSESPNGTTKKYTLTQIKDYTVTHTTAVNYTTAGENVIFCTDSGITITLSNADTAVGRQVTIVNEFGSTVPNYILIDGESGQTINDESSFKISQNNASITLVCDGTNWKIQSLVDLTNLTFLIQTEDAVPAIIGSIPIAENRSFTVTGMLVAAKDDLTEGIGGNFTATVIRDTGNIRFVGSGNPILNLFTDTAATMTITVDTGTQSLVFTANGLAATTIDWLLKLDLMII